ncbi:MAG TPA: hypothetical protein VK737_08955, partial [Opitutales bacterium]|nr:hypothetical protein [Opitutales bacterium]
MARIIFICGLFTTTWISLSAQEIPANVVTIKPVAPPPADTSASPIPAPAAASATAAAAAATMPVEPLPPTQSVPLGTRPLL